MSTKALFELIKNRRSIFPAQFDPSKSVAKADVEELLEAANWAPNHGKTEPWRFVVFAGDARKALGEKLRSVFARLNQAEPNPVKERKLLHLPQQSSHVLAIVGHYGTKTKIPQWEETAAIAMAVQNIYLMVHAKGLGGYWSSPKIIEDQELHSFLKLLDNEKLLGFFYLGVPKSDVQAESKRGPMKEKVSWREEEV